MIPEQLELTPTILASLLTGLTDEQMDWKPAPERFSITEVLTHLAHTEHHAYRVKYEAFAQQEAPLLEAYDTDGLVERGEYAGKPWRESWAEFKARREENLAFLRSLPAEYASRSGHHSKVGTIRLSELLNECSYHDLGHIRQVAELVRAQKYYPRMGPYMHHYTVNP